MDEVKLLDIGQLLALQQKPAHLFADAGGASGPEIGCRQPAAGNNRPDGGVDLG